MLTSGQQEPTKADNRNQEQRLCPLLTLPYVLPGEQAFSLPATQCRVHPLTVGHLPLRSPLEDASGSTRLSNLSFLKAIYFKMENL